MMKDIIKIKHIGDIIWLNINKDGFFSYFI